MNPTYVQKSIWALSRVCSIGIDGNWSCLISRIRFLEPHELLAATFKELVKRTGMPATEIDFAYGATYTQNTRRSNMTRHAIIEGGFPATLPGLTIVAACISGFAAAQAAMNSILTGTLYNT